MTMTDREPLREQAKILATTLVGPVRDEFWPEGTLPVDTLLLARRMGLTVITTPLDFPVWATLSGDAHGVTIHVGPDRPGGLVRSAAHVLGHYLDLRSRGIEQFCVVERATDLPQAATPECIRAAVIELELRVPEAALYERRSRAGTYKDLADELGVTSLEIAQQKRLYERDHADRGGAAVRDTSHWDRRVEEMREARDRGTQPPADWW